MNFQQKFLFILLVFPLSSFANYTVNMPLEVGIGGNGGNLPVNSIIFSNSGGNPEEPEEDPRLQECLDKEPQVRSIIESYGKTLQNFRAFIYDDTLYCSASYSLPPSPQREMVIQDLLNIGVGTPM